jgi:hypothetical protein
VNMGMNLCVPCNVGNFVMWLRTCELLKKDLACCVKFVSANSFPQTCGVDGADSYVMPPRNFASYQYT